MSTLDEKINLSLLDGYLPCPAAFGVAAAVKTSRSRVGDAANKLKIQVSDCQLGCFDTLKATHQELAGKKIGDLVIEKVKVSAVDGRITCSKALRIANSLHVVPMEVGDAATLLNIKIKNCQLGCFP